LLYNTTTTTTFNSDKYSVSDLFAVIVFEIIIITINSCRLFKYYLQSYKNLQLEGVFFEKLKILKFYTITSFNLKAHFLINCVKWIKKSY